MQNLNKMYINDTTARFHAIRRPLREMDSESVDVVGLEFYNNFYVHSIVTYSTSENKTAVIHSFVENENKNGRRIASLTFACRAGDISSDFSGVWCLGGNIGEYKSKRNLHTFTIPPRNLSKQVKNLINITLQI